jgi:hypothetical protein
MRRVWKGAAIFYKGPALAAMAYGNVALREFSDLDILMKKEDVPGNRHPHNFGHRVVLSGEEER